MIISLQPKQKQLLSLIEKSDYEWIGYGGARGGAKSHAIRDCAIYLGLKYNIKSLIFRRYRQELFDNHYYPIQQLYPELRPHMVKSPEIFLYHPQTKLPMIKLGYAEHIEDIYKEQGSEYQIIFVDEATQSTQEMIEWLQTSCRDSRGQLPSRAKMVLSCNPGGAGHGFIKRIFVDQIYVESEKAENYTFIQAHVWDNVAWVIRQLHKDNYTVKDYYEKWNEQQRIDYCLQYSDYARRLSGLPDQLKKAYLWGNWDVFGGMFFTGFDKSKEIIKPFEVPREWPLVASMDPGFASPLSFGLQTKDIRGNIYRIATYYAVDKIPQHAIAIKKWLKDENSPVYPYLKGRLPDYTVSGHDAFAKLDRNAIISNEDTVCDYFQAQDIPLSYADIDRISGWWQWKSLIPDRYYIFDGLNQSLIQQMTGVVSDKLRPEDIEGRGNDPNIVDHTLDDARYGIKAIYTPLPPAPEDEFKDKPHWGEYQPKTADYRNPWS